MSGAWILADLMSTRSLCLPSTVINKYKRRRFQKTKNLLTGETEADPEMIKVNEWTLGAAGCSWPSSQPMWLSPVTTPEPLRGLGQVFSPL